MLEFIDSYCMIGNRVSPREGSLQKMEGYFDVMNRCDITKSIVFHGVAKEGDYRLGNNMLTDIIKDNPRFLGQWIVVPNCTGEFLDSDNLLKQMRYNNIKTLRILPKSMGFSLKPYASRGLFSTLEQYQIPIFVDSIEIGWDELYAFLKDYPKLPLILCNTGCESARKLFPILNSCQNLYIETSTYIAHNGISEFVNKFGADRLIFGSGLPNSCVTGAVAMIYYSDISEKEKKKIAKENITMLLEEAVL